MNARNEDFLFAQEAQNLGYVTEEQVDEGFLLQRRMANDLQIEERLAVILVKRGWMAEEQARRVYGIIEPQGTHTEIEGYKLVQKVGSGAMGTVYKAIHKSLHRVVAIKILRRDLAADKTQIERLKREAKLLADLDHPNIVRAFDAGESNGFPYLVMEYVEGETLRDRISREGALSNDEALRITRALADALEKARRMGVVHRDVKPGNILLSKSGTPKLMDLGLAKGPIDFELTQIGATVGTPQFMSPEQAESPERADTRSDIYSLGATLYAMVTTRPPFEGTTLAEIITKVMSSQPVPPRVRNEDVSPEVSHLIERMMLKDASLRYATPAQVVEDIDMIRGGQSIIPKGFQGNWEAYLLRRRWRQRKRWMIGLGAALLLAAIGTWWSVDEAREKANKQEADQLAERVLRVPEPSRDVLQKTLELHAQQARAEYDKLERLQSSSGALADRRTEAKARVEVLTRSLKVMRALTGKINAWEGRLAKERYAEVAAHVRGFESQVGDGIEPAYTKWREFQRRVLERSERAWRAAQNAALDRPAGDLESFVTLWRAWAAALDGDYIDTKALREARDRAAPVAAAAARIDAEVQAAREAFSGAAIAPRVAELEFFQLKSELLQRIQSVRQKVIAELRIFNRNGAPVEGDSLLGENGLVAGVLRHLSDDLDAQVEHAWGVLKRTAEEMPPRKGVDLLTRFAAEASRGEAYPRLAREAEALEDKINAEYVRQTQLAKEAYDATLDRVMRHLRSGDPAGLAGEVEDAVEDRVLAVEKAAELRALSRDAVPALEEIQRAALGWLARKEGRLSKVPVRSPDGRWIMHDRWTVQGVDVENGTIDVRRQIKGSRTSVERIRIGQVRLDRVRDWALQSGRPLPKLADPLVELALLEPVRDDPGHDLRARLAAFRRVQEALRAADDAGAWTAVTRRFAAELDTIQGQREQQAEDLAYSFNLLFNGQKQEYKRALQLWERISDPDGRLRYTGAFNSKRKDLERSAEVCRNAIAQEELLRLFDGGVDVKELKSGRHRITFDFDDPQELDNFHRCFGQLEPTSGPITPVARGYRLKLLKGVEGLLLDRPLSLWNLFDTAEKISVEFTIDTGRGSSILAVDIDGVQIAISSLDPNYWRWPFPAGTPLLDDETSPPEFDYYGRGRGIAFHAGKDFGRSFPRGSWSWDKRSDGSNFERWKDLSYLRKHRAVLFAFAPGQTYRVRVERERDTMRLVVDDQLVVQKTEAGWAERGRNRTPGDDFRNGSGLIQILTLTPLALENLELEGRVTDTWRGERKRILEDRAKARAEDGGKK